MIVQIAKAGSGFRGVLDYAMDAKKGPDGKAPRPIAGNMAGQTPRDLAAEFGQVRSIRPDISKPVFHASLSAAEGERLSDAQWSAACDQFMKSMNFDGQWSAVRHSDTVAKGGKDHVHIIGNRIDGMGKRWDATNDRARAMAAARKIEADLGLQSGAPKPRAEAGIKVTKNEIDKSKRTGEPIVRVQMARDVESVLREKPADLRDFQRRLADRDIHMTAHTHPQTGQVRGLSFERGNDHFSGSQLSRRAGYKQIADRLGDKGQGPNSQQGALPGSRPAGASYIPPPPPAAGPGAAQANETDVAADSHECAASVSALAERADIYEGMGEVAYSRATAVAAARNAAKIEQERERNQKLAAGVAGGKPAQRRPLVTIGDSIRDLANQPPLPSSAEPAGAAAAPAGPGGGGVG